MDFFNFLYRLDSLPSLLAFGLATGNLWVAYSEIIIYLTLGIIFIIIGSTVIISALKFVHMVIKLPLITLGFLFFSIGILLEAQAITIFLGGPWHFFNIVVGVITISIAILFLVVITILKPAVPDITNLLNTYD